MTLIEIINEARLNYPNYPILALDSNGWYYCYQNEPIKRDAQWIQSAGFVIVGNYTGSPINWENSLIDVRTIKV